MIKGAIEAMKRGEMILLYDFDDREGETDFAIRSDCVKPSDILRMRKDGGGLICTSIHSLAAERLGLPFACDLLQDMNCVEKTGDARYDPANRSSFSLWVNHRDTFTGIPDRDRALTVTKIAEQVQKSLNGGGHNFGAEFKTPGHMAILRANEELLDKRRGQTELSVALAEMADVTPAITICEMLDNETGLALKKEDAIAYGKKHGIVFVEGSEVIEAWESFRKSLTNA